MEENPSKENIMRVWKDCTIEDAITVIKTVMRAMKPETINSCWRKLCPDAVHDITRFMAETIKEIMKGIMIRQKKKKVGGGGLQDLDSRAN